MNVARRRSNSSFLMGIRISDKKAQEISNDFIREKVKKRLERDFSSLFEKRLKEKHPLLMQDLAFRVLSFDHVSEDLEGNFVIFLNVDPLYIGTN